jgi:hypothetical protein
VGTTGRHRTSSSVLWFPVIVSALVGVTLGSGVTAVAGGSGTEPVSNQAVAPFSTPTPSSRPVGSIGFAEPATGPAGLSLTVLPPEKIKGGVRLTIALVNNTGAPITVDTGELGPHDLRFNGATVPMTMTPTKKKLMPDEGYTYQCVIQLPTMDVGQLAFALDAMTVTGQAAGD